MNTAATSVQARDEREGQAKELLRALRARSGSAQYGWGNEMSVEAGLLLEGFRFEFVQAVRLLTLIAKRLPRQQTSSSVAGPERAHAAPLPQVDHAPEHALISEEAHASTLLPRMDQPQSRISVRLRSRIAFDFPPASVHGVRLSSEVVGQIEVIANLMALAGNNAPLPEPFAELVLERQKVRDMALTDFLDLFHHRLLELYYASTLHTSPWLALVHPSNNELAQMVYAVAGLGPGDLRNRMRVPDRVWLRYAGLLWHRPRSASALAKILADHFKVRVRIGSPVGRWFPVEPEDQSRLNRATCVLGKTASLGNRVWLANASFQLHLGPMPGAKFDEFLPGARLHRQLIEMVRFFLRDNIEPELVLERDRADAEAAHVGGARLGWTSWLRPGALGGALELRLSPDSSRTNSALAR